MANSKLKKRAPEAMELDLKCFMNLMVVLIPMLLISAEFAKVAVIEMKLPARGSQTERQQETPSDENTDDKLLLTAIITDSVVTLGAKGGFLPTIFYREFHRYLAKDGTLDTLIEYVPGAAQPTNPRTGRELTIHERYDIFLRVADENFNILNAYHTEFDEMLTNEKFEPVFEVNVGDTLFALTNPRRRVVVTSDIMKGLKQQPLSAYDELRNRLMMVKERYKDASDADDIIIAAENEVIYDKIIQIMDAARHAEFPNISISKMRG